LDPPTLSLLEPADLSGLTDTETTRSEYD